MFFVAKCRWVLMLLSVFAHHANALTITSVSHKAMTNESGQLNRVNIRFALDEDAAVELNIYDGRDYLIRQLPSKSYTAGDNSIEWGLDDNGGNRVPDGHYHYTLTAKGSGGNSVTYDTTDLTGGDLRPLSNLEWDNKTGELKYSVRKSSLVNIRAGVENGGPLLLTLLNWYPRSYGMHTEIWNGKDASGQLDISQIEGMHLSGTAYTLSSNTVIVGQPAAAPEFIKEITWDKQQRVASSVKYSGRLKLGVANLSDKRDFTVIMEIPDDFKQAEDGNIILSGVVPVRITAPDDQLQRINNQRFEPVLFVDGKYQSEIEVGFLPLTWRLDTTVLTPGDHYIAINLRGFDGEYGVAIKKFRIEE